MGFHGNFSSQGNTVCLSVTSSAHTAVQVTSNSNGSFEYLITNTSSNPVFIAVGTTSSVTATLPVDGTPGNSFPLPPNWTSSIAGPPNAYFSAICAASQTATVYITPGDGGI